MKYIPKSVVLIGMEFTDSPRGCNLQDCSGNRNIMEDTIVNIVIVKNVLYSIYNTVTEFLSNKTVRSQ